MKYEISFETTLPPWLFNYEVVEAEDRNYARKKFYEKHQEEYGHIIKIVEI